ncbi:MAG: ferrous iron transport protein A [Planctomycetota bacterium]|jgi:ferrous iron transport protein A
MASSRTLDDLNIGETGEVGDILTGHKLGRRLLEMGLTMGTAISLVRRAPMGDPIEVLVRGYHLTLRRSEAQVVQLRD